MGPTAKTSCNLTSPMSQAASPSQYPGSLNAVSGRLSKASSCYSHLMPATTTVRPVLLPEPLNQTTCFTGNTSSCNNEANIVLSLAVCIWYCLCDSTSCMCQGWTDQSRGHNGLTAAGNSMMLWLGTEQVSWVALKGTLQPSSQKQLLLMLLIPGRLPVWLLLLLLLRSLQSASQEVLLVCSKQQLHILVQFWRRQSRGCLLPSGCAVLLLLLLQGNCNLSLQPGRVLWVRHLQALVLPWQLSIELPQSPAVGAHEGGGHAGEAARQLLSQLLMHAGGKLVGKVMM